MFSFDYQYRVRYADVDQMGFVYYGHYARFYEIVRVEALRSLGLLYKDLEATGVMMPVYENKSRYLQPAKYDDLLTIRVIIKDLPKARMVYHYEIYNEEQTLLHTGESTLVFLRKDNNRLTTASKEMVDVLKPFFIK